MTANGTFLAMMLLWSGPICYAMLKEANDVKNHGHVEAATRGMLAVYAMVPPAISLVLLASLLMRWWTSVTGT